jgi:hypothetical protein
VTVGDATGTKRRDNPFRRVAVTGATRQTIRLEQGRNLQRRTAGIERRPDL